MARAFFSLWDWLDFVESFPIVPRWRWTNQSWGRWKAQCDRHQIPCCRDGYGNILLGAETVETFHQKVRQKSPPFLLQAHLDHPGAVVASRIDDFQGHGRYSAVIQGGLSKRVLGAVFQLYDVEGRPVGEVMADKKTEGIREQWVTFKTSQRFEMPGYLCSPRKNTFADSEQWVEGWGSDNHVGCAVLLHYLSQNKDGSVLGILTLDEEIGAFGLQYFFDSLKRVPLSNIPLLLSLEVTREYPEAEFLCGRGARWRSADRGGDLDPSFLSWLKGVGEKEPLSLQGGVCEAGIWSRLGGRGACLVISSQFAHNGLAENEWRAERVWKEDVIDLAKKLEQCVRRIPPSFQQTEGETTRHAPATIQIHDHLAVLRTQALESKDYLSALKKVMPPWHALHQRLHIPLVKFSHRQWPYWREQILSSEKWSQAIQQEAPLCFKMVQKWVGAEAHRTPEAALHLLMGAPFNASHLAAGIAFSADKLEEEDLRRILIHEFTHWWIGPVLLKKGFRPLLTTTLNEGLAGIVSRELLGISAAQAVGLSEAEYRKYLEEEDFLKERFLDWWAGKVFEVKRGRHEIVAVKQLPHPFVISKGGDWKKFGYFLGFQFALARRRRRKNWIDWLNNITEEDFFSFLKQPRRGYAQNPRHLSRRQFGLEAGAAL